jgi:hypothetical protein
MSLRDEIRELCLAHDRFMAEQASEPIRRSRVSETELPGILYRDYDGNAQNAAAAADTPPSGEAEGEAYPPFDQLKKGLAEFVVIWCNHKLTERDAKITKLEGKVDALLTLLGQRAEDQFKSGLIIDLPDWRKRTDAAA